MKKIYIPGNDVCVVQAVPATLTKDYMEANEIERAILRREKGALELICRTTSVSGFKINITFFRYFDPENVFLKIII